MAQQNTLVLANSNNVFDIPLAQIIAKPQNNYRTQKSQEEQEALQESMKRNGQLQSVEVVKLDNGMFELLLGFRRFEAAKALEWPTLRAEVVTDKDGKPLDEKNRRIRNAAENLARENLTTWDQALAFTDLKKNYDLSPALIGQNTGKSQSYINNLIRVYDSLSDFVRERWKKENSPGFATEGTSAQVCTMNWLVSVIKLPRVEQDIALKKALGLIPDDDEDDNDGDSNREPKPAGTATVRASMVNLKAALEAAKKGKKELDSKDELGRARFDGIISTLNFAIGNKQGIPKIYTNPKPGEKAAKSEESNDEGDDD